MTADDQLMLPAVAEQQDSSKEVDASSRPMTEKGIVYFKARSYGGCSIAASENKDFQHALLTRASGKNATVVGFDFRYAELNDCYFHGATFENYNFTRAKIRRSNFRTTTFRNCTFDYVTIEETPLDYR